MRKIYTFIFIITFSLICLLTWVFYPFLKNKQQSFSSPLPSFLNLLINNQVTTIEIWKPFQKLTFTNIIASPNISATEAVSYDITTDKMLFKTNQNKKVPMASLTKIMTAIIALEHPRKDDKYVVLDSDLVGEDSMGLESGEILSLKELLLGLILHSGNDAAEVLAHNFPGGRSKFIEAMNKKATSLGLTNTNFTNPTGLEGDGKQYTTANDLLVITRFALDNFSVFKEVVSTVEYTIEKSDTHKEYYLENETNLLTTYPGVKGVKTGYTPEAGLCLVTFLDYQNHKIIAVVLGSENRRDDMKQILDYSLKEIGIKPPFHS